MYVTAGENRTFIFLTFSQFIKRFVLETGSTPPSTSSESAIIETRGVSFRSTFWLVNVRDNLVFCIATIKYYMESDAVQIP